MVILPDFVRKRFALGRLILEKWYAERYWTLEITSLLLLESDTHSDWLDASRA